jgi:AAA+ ATPase superfamily predicted ATPase
VAASGPLVVVLDEFPWACEMSPTLEGELQKAWDRYLQHLPILLVLVGSDLAMMQRLTEHDRPLYGRASEVVIQPFNPAEVAEAIDASNPMTAFDAYLTTGGYPKLVDDVRRAGGIRAYIAHGVRDENTDLVVVAQRSLDAEFPSDAQARRVLSAIGGHDVGHSTFSTVVGVLGDDAATSGVALTRSLRVLGDQKRVLTIEHPAGAKSNTRQRRYRVADPYLRFWFRFIEPHLANIARGRGDVALAAFDTAWSSWRGLAIEPVVRGAIARMAPSIPTLARVTDLAPWWNRDNSIEVDIVASANSSVEALGTIKWRERRKVTPSELRDLAAARSVVPHSGAARLVVVCPAGAESSVDADVVLTDADLMRAWD